MSIAVKAQIKTGTADLRSNFFFNDMKTDGSVQRRMKKKLRWFKLNFYK